MAADERLDGRDFVVCDESALPPGRMRMVPVGKFGVGVYNVDGYFYALTNYCPHEGAPLCLGRIQGTNRVPPGESHGIEHVMEGSVVRCPWHGWEFDITTGKTLADQAKGIRTYDVRIEDGKVILRR
jgi:nitrite reductase/ring-hydroxylating ferredoxin subunit